MSHWHPAVLLLYTSQLLTALMVDASSFHWIVAVGVYNADPGSFGSPIKDCVLIRFVLACNHFLFQNICCQSRPSKSYWLLLKHVNLLGL
jgi:hypothetical protein